MYRARKLSHAAAIACGAFLAAGAASADITLEERLTVEGAGLMGMANMTGHTTTTISGDRARTESDLQMQSRLVRAFARGMGPTAEIVRLDEDRIYQLDPGKKQYTETSFEELRTQLQQAMQQAAQAPAGPVDESQCEWSEPKAQVKRTGEKASLAGLTAERLSIVASQSCRNDQSGQVCEFAIVLDQWLTPQLDGGEEALKFHKAYAERLGLGATGPRDLAQRAESMFGRYRDMWQEIARQSRDVQGYPVKSSFALAIGGPQCKSVADARAAGAPAGTGAGAAAAEAAGEAAGARAGGSVLGGVAGQIGGKIAGSIFRRRKEAPEPTPAAETPAAAAQTVADGLVPLLTVSSELLSVSHAPAASGAFDIPADFTKVSQVD